MVGTIGLAGIIGCGYSKEEYGGHIPKYEVTTRIHKKNGKYLDKHIIIQATNPTTKPYMVAGIDSSNDEIIDVWILNNDEGLVECSKGIGYTTCTPEQEKIVKDLIESAENAVKY